MHILFHPDADDEANAAHDWYADRSIAAAESFERELDHSVKAIADNPTLWSDYVHGTKRYLMKRFPFVIVYRPKPSHIEIIAVAHGRRRPGYWRERLG